MKIVLLLIVFQCKSCGPHDYTAWGPWWNLNRISTIRVYISRQFDALMRESIRGNVIQAWYTHTLDCGFSVQYTDDSSSSNIEIEISPGLYDATTHRLMAVGLTMILSDPLCMDTIRGEIYHDRHHPCVEILIAPPETLERCSIDVFTVLRHEMGHALGLGHAKNPDCLMYPEAPRNFVTRNIGDGEDSGLVCIYGSLFGERVRPSVGLRVSDSVKVLDLRHVSIKKIVGTCNGYGTGGADSLKIKMNFYHSGKTMTWETIKTFSYASRYYKCSIVVELPPDDSNYTG